MGPFLCVELISLKALRSHW